MAFFPKMMFLFLLLLPATAHSADCLSQQRLAERVQHWRSTGMHYSAALRLANWRDVGSTELARAIVAAVYAGRSPNEVCYEVFSR